MKHAKPENLTLRAIVESELEKRNCDGLYSPCGRCERGCSRSVLFSCGKACADCRPGLRRYNPQRPDHLRNRLLVLLSKQAAL